PIGYSMKGHPLCDSVLAQLGLLPTLSKDSGPSLIVVVSSQGVVRVCMELNDNEDHHIPTSSSTPLISASTLLPPPLGIGRRTTAANAPPPPPAAAEGERTTGKEVLERRPQPSGSTGSTGSLTPVYPYSNDPLPSCSSSSSSSSSSSLPQQQHCNYYYYYYHLSHIGPMEYNYPIPTTTAPIDDDDEEEEEERRLNATTAAKDMLDNALS
ncbi:hypothetical protein FOZ62_010671, partial [Perkinsus olseni]